MTVPIQRACPTCESMVRAGGCGDRWHGPICGHCHPCRPEDIDPTTTVYLCPDHQRGYDEQIAPLIKHLVKCDRTEPITFKSIREWR